MCYKSIILIFIAILGCTTAIYRDWTYTMQGYSSEGQPCMNNCVNQRCVVDWDGHEAACVVTNTQTPKYRTRFGKYCLSNCNYFGFDYEWCFDSIRKTWDHCNSGDSHVSIYGVKCIGECTKHSSGYFWCNVESGWQFCAPPREGADMITESPVFDVNNQ